MSITLIFGILGQVWYLIVSIPNLCTLTIFNKLFEQPNVRAFHENPNLIHIYTKKSRLLFSSAEMFEASSKNSLDPDQTAPVSSLIWVHTACPYTYVNQ